MTKHRVVGFVGSGNIRVRTEWIDAPRGEVEGIAVGLEMRGWKDVEVETDAE